MRPPPDPGRLADPSDRPVRPRLRSSPTPMRTTGPGLDLPLLRRLARRYGPEEEKALDALLREAGLQAP